MGEPFLGTPQSVRPPEDYLDSWKEIAAYLNRDVTTAQRWEKREGMPVHRHQHDRMGSVYAFGSELDAWVQSRRVRLEEDVNGVAGLVQATTVEIDPGVKSASSVGKTLALAVIGTILAALGGLATFWLRAPVPPPGCSGIPNLQAMDSTKKTCLRMGAGFILRWQNQVV